MQIYIGKNNYPSAAELNGDYKVPKVTGVMDADTSSAIAQFQITNFNRLILKNFFDGRIDPANYKNRRLHSHRPQISIVLLHILAAEAAVAQGHSDYIDGMSQLRDLYLSMALYEARVNQQMKSLMNSYEVVSRL